MGLVDFGDKKITPELLLFYNLQKYKSVLLTGAGGVGKSYLTKKIIKKFKNPIVLGSTNQSAILLKGQTIHDFFKLYDCRTLPQLDSRDMYKIEDMKRKYPLYNVETLKDILYSQQRELLKVADCIIIDEVSMLDKNTFELFFYRLEKWVDEKKFRELPILLVGDFYQLSPVQGEYCFKSEYFDDFHIIELDEVKRTESKLFIKVLKKIRKGYIDEEVKDLLDFFKGNYFLNLKKDTLNDAIHIYPKNNEVYKHNQLMLDKIGDTLDLKVKCNTTFKGEGVTNKDVEKFIRDSQFEEELRYKIGAKVVFIANSKNYYNGLQGEIVDSYLDDEGEPIVKVKIVGGSIIEVSQFPFQKFEYKKVGGKKLKALLTITVMQMPFKISYAITVHKSQGLSIDGDLYIDPSTMFAKHQFYVAISRCVNPKKLSIKGANFHKLIKVDFEVKKFFTNKRDYIQKWIGY